MTFDEIFNYACDNTVYDGNSVSFSYIQLRSSGRLELECKDRFPCMGRAFNEVENEEPGRANLHRRSLLLYLMKSEQCETYEEAAVHCDAMIDLMFDFIATLRSLNLRVEIIKAPFRQKNVFDISDVGASCEIDVIFNPCQIQAMTL